MTLTFNLSVRLMMVHWQILLLLLPIWSELNYMGRRTHITIITIITYIHLKGKGSGEQQSHTYTSCGPSEMAKTKEPHN